MRTALYLGQGCELYLTDSLAGDVEAFPDFFEGLGLAAGKAESVLEDHPLAFGEAAECLAHAGLQEAGFREVVGRLGFLIRDKVTQLRGVVLPDWGLQGDRTPRYAPDAHDLLGVYLHDGGDLFVRGVAVELGAEAALDPVILVDLLDHVDGDPDRTSFVGYRPGDGLTDPPRRVRRELESLAVVELLYGPHQPDVALLDQIEQRDAPSRVLLGYGDDEPEVGLGEVGFGPPVAALYAPREVGLLSLREKGSLADLVQVHLDRVPRVAALQVAFEHLFDELGVLVFAHRLREESGVDHLDAVLAEEPVDLLYLVGREVDLLQEVEYFTRLQRAGLLTGLEELLYLLYVPQVTLRLQIYSGNFRLKPSCSLHVIYLKRDNNQFAPARLGRVVRARPTRRTSHDGPEKHVQGVPRDSQRGEGAGYARHHRRLAQGRRGRRPARSAEGRGRSGGDPRGLAKGGYYLGEGRRGPW